MRVARTVADVLAEHVTFEVECIDRMFLNVHQPRLQHAGGILSFVHRHLGLPIASTAPLAKISDRFDRAVHRFAKDEGIQWVDFVKGQRKDDVMAERLRHFTPEEGVVSIGRAKELFEPDLSAAPHASHHRTSLKAGAQPRRAQAFVLHPAAEPAPVGDCIGSTPVARSKGWSP